MAGSKQASKRDEWNERKCRFLFLVVRDEAGKGKKKTLLLYVLIMDVVKTGTFTAVIPTY